MTQGAAAAALMGSVPPPPDAGVTLRTFLETIAPGERKDIKSLSQVRNSHLQWQVEFPRLELYCTMPYCRGVRYFESSSKAYVNDGGLGDVFVQYVCRNCGVFFKTFALRIWLDKDKRGAGSILKFGEAPAFGPPTPARVSAMLGDEKEHFIKGRRAETQGLGIAAFAYYRRVVENRKNELIDQILKVANKLGSSNTEQLDDLVAARAETQFSRAIDLVKHGIPEALLVNGHNPLKLLHSALSEGIHERTDEQCLEDATNIRLVLFDLVDRMATALKDDAELNKAVGRLLKNPQQGKRASSADAAASEGGPEAGAT